MRKGVLIVLAVVCALAVLVWSSHRSSTRDATAVRELESASPTPPAVELNPPARGEEPQVEHEDAPPARAPLTSASTVSSAPALLRLSGMILVVDGYGEEESGEDGRFQLMLHAGNHTKGYAVEIERGAWGLECAAHIAGARVDALSVSSFVMDKEEARAEHPSAERLPLPPDGRLDLRVHLQGVCVLHVRERGSAGEVGSQCTYPQPSTGNELEYPGPWGSYEESPSPLHIPAPWEGTSVFHVRSANHAWQKLEIGPQPCERVVELEPGGDLELTVEGPDADVSSQLRLFRGENTGGAPLAQIALWKQRSFELESLPAGTLTVGAYLGDWQPLVLARTTVEIVAGKTAAATLTLQEPPRPSCVRLAGTLRMPVEWGLADFELRLERQDAPVAGWAGEVVLHEGELRALGGPELFAWTAEVPPGSYGAILPETGFFSIFDVGPDGRDDVRLEVPLPAVVRLRCVGDDGEEPRVESVDWGVLTERNMLPARAPPVREPESGRWTFRAPVGRLLIRAHTADDTQQLAADVVPGVNELELRVPRSTGVQPILKDGASEIPWPADRLARLEPTEEHVDAPRAVLRRGRLTLHANQAGLYRLVVPEIPGYEPVADELVRVEAGMMQPHVVALRRRGGR